MLEQKALIAALAAAPTISVIHFVGAGERDVRGIAVSGRGICLARSASTRRVKQFGVPPSGGSSRRVNAELRTVFPLAIREKGGLTDTTF